jgi:hypothetical protein
MPTLNPSASRDRYRTALGVSVDVAIVIALAYSSPADKLTALYEVDARSNYSHHADIEPTLQALEAEVGA